MLCRNEYVSYLLYWSSTVLCNAKTRWGTNLTSKHPLGYAGKTKAKYEKINSTVPATYINTQHWVLDKRIRWKGRQKGKDELKRMKKRKKERKWEKMREKERKRDHQPWFWCWSSWWDVSPGFNVNSADWM